VLQWQRGQPRRTLFRRERHRSIQQLGEDGPAVRRAGQGLHSGTKGSFPN